MTEIDRKLNKLRQPNSLTGLAPADGQHKARVIGGAIVDLFERLSLGKSNSDIDPGEPTCLDQRLALGLPIAYGKECDVLGCSNVREKIFGLGSLSTGDCAVQSMPSQQE